MWGKYGLAVIGYGYRIQDTGMLQSALVSQIQEMCHFAHHISSRTRPSGNTCSWSHAANGQLKVVVRRACQVDPSPRSMAGVCQKKTAPLLETPTSNTDISTSR
jgi:hypothetical protein